ncbi:hypothetical protein [Clostridium butyricum]
MELTELGLNEEQLNGVNSILQSEGDKIRTKYTKEISELKENMKSSEDFENLNNNYKEIEGKYNSLTNELLELRDYKTKNEETLRENKINSMLEEKGLSGIAQYLKISDDTDLETYINEIAETVSKQQKTFIPQQANNIKSEITKEQFSKMNYMERQKLYLENKELYDILSK